MSKGWKIAIVIAGILAVLVIALLVIRPYIIQQLDSLITCKGMGGPGGIQ